MGKQIQTLITGFILEELLEDFESIDPDENLLADGMIDSLGMVRLVGFIEDELGVSVPPEDFVVEHFQTLSTISRYLAQHGAFRHDS